MKTEIVMGRTAPTSALTKSESALLDLEELLSTRLLVQGNSGSGKSHLLRRLLEQSAPWVQQCVIDPEGDFVSLAEKFGHIIVEPNRQERELIHIAERIRQHRVSVILNLEGLDLEKQMRASAIFLNGLFEAERDYWYPMLVVVDEAQIFAPTSGGDVTEEARKSSLNAMTNLMCRGRKRGLAGVIATQRLAKLAKNVAAEASNFLMGRTFLDIDMARAADLLGMERRQAEMFRDLERGRFIALGPALSKRPLPILIGEVETSARSSNPILTPLPERSEDTEALIFAPSTTERALKRETPREEIVKSTEDILQEVEQKQKQEQEKHAPPPKAPSLFPEIEKVEKEQQCVAIIKDILADPEATYRPLAVLYQDFQVHCRMRRIKQSWDLPQFRRQLAIAHADIDEKMAQTPEWQKFLDLSENLSDDLQGVFLVIARAALMHTPCPSDAHIAKLYGTHSLSRARRLFAYFEERDLIVMRSDISGRRIAYFPDLNLETAPGDLEENL